MTILKLKKPAIHNDVVYREESCIDMKDEGRAKFMLGMGLAEKMPEGTPLTQYKPYESPKPVTATDVASAVAEAISKGMSFPATPETPAKASKNVSA